MVLTACSYHGSCFKTREDFFKNKTFTVMDPDPEDKEVMEKTKADVEAHIEAIYKLGNETCLRFEKLNPRNSSANLRLKPLLKDPDSEKEQRCSGSGIKPPRFSGSVNIYKDCGGVAEHELGHAMGMIHTQTRWDRDGYVKIYKENIEPKDYSSFRPDTPEKYGSDIPYDRIDPYDFGSAMHYGENTFRAKEAGDPDKPVIESKNPFYQNTMGRSDWSFTDIQGFNKGYKCDCVPKQRNNSVLGLTGLLIEKLCTNGGYPDPNNCGKCKCPMGFGGHSCKDPEGILEPNNTYCGERVIEVPHDGEWHEFERKWSVAEELLCSYHFKSIHHKDRVEVKNISSYRKIQIKTGWNVSMELNEQKHPNWQFMGYVLSDFKRVNELIEERGPIKSVSNLLVVRFFPAGSNRVRFLYRSDANRLSRSKILVWILILIVLYVQL